MIHPLRGFDATPPEDAGIKLMKVYVDVLNHRQSADALAKEAIFAALKSDWDNATRAALDASCTGDGTWWQLLQTIEEVRS